MAWPGSIRESTWIYGDKEIKKLRDQVHYAEAWKIAVKWGLTKKNIVDHDGRIFYFISPGL